MSILKAWARVFFPVKFQKAEDEIFDWGVFQEKIGYKVKNKELFATALRHRSHVSCSRPDQKQSNERLEFLGDAVVNFIVGDFVYKKFEKSPEGDLTKMRSTFVSREYMAKIGRKLDLGSFVAMGEGELRSGGRSKDSIMSNTLESIIGAVYLESGFEAAKKFTERMFMDNFEETLKYEGANYKGDLLEIIQKKHMPRPEFVTQKEDGPDHKKTYTVAIQVDNKVLGTGKGKSKKIAEQEASKMALREMGVKVGKKRRGASHSRHNPHNTHSSSKTTSGGIVKKSHPVKVYGSANAEAHTAAVKPEKSVKVNKPRPTRAKKTVEGDVEAKVTKTRTTRKPKDEATEKVNKPRATRAKKAVEGDVEVKVTKTRATKKPKDDTVEKVKKPRASRAKKAVEGDAEVKVTKTRTTKKPKDDTVDKVKKPRATKSTRMPRGEEAPPGQKLYTAPGTKKTYSVPTNKTVKKAPQRKTDETTNE